VWERIEINTKFWSKNLKEIVDVENIGIYIKAFVKMDLIETGGWWAVWIHLVRIGIGTCGGLL
jgi:hypothetical protein